MVSVSFVGIHLEERLQMNAYILSFSMRFIYTVKKDGDLHIIMITWMNFLSGNEASKPLSNAWIRIGITGIITLAHILENYSKPSPV